MCFGKLSSLFPLELLTFIATIGGVGTPLAMRLPPKFPSCLFVEFPLFNY